MKNEIKRYDEQGNWDFSKLNIVTEYETNWDMYEEVKKYSDEKSLILDLGTAAGERIFKQMPKDIGYIIGTDLSFKMIENAKKNTKVNPNVKVKFAIMDNLKLNFPDGIFDIVTARHTIINAKEIYRVLNDNGILIVRGVDKEDCQEIKDIFGRGQCYNDKIAISQQDYQDIKNAGFKDVKLFKIFANEYFKTKEDLMELLLRVPILNDFESDRKEIEENLFKEYIEKYSTNKGILLKRKYYGIIAKK